MTEQLEIGGAPPQEPESAAPVSPAREVFDHWRLVLNHPRAKFTADRKRKIESRLAEDYTVEDLKLVCDGVITSDFHMGRDRERNPSGKVYDGIDLLFRNAGKVETYREWGIKAKRRVKPDERGPDWGYWESTTDILEGNARKWWGKRPDLVCCALEAYAEDETMRAWASDLLEDLGR